MEEQLDLNHRSRICPSEHVPDECGITFRPDSSLDTRDSATYKAIMKGFPALLCALLIPCGFTSCESDMPPPRDEVSNKLQRGITGQGTLYQPDRTDDPYVRDPDRVGY